MAPCDPYDEPMEWPTPHERLVSYLGRRESPPMVVIREKSQPLTVDDLPTEILDIVLEYLPNKHDLAQVCKVDRRFFATATPILYREVHYNITETIDPRLSQMFTTSNTGLRFVKKVFITSNNNGSDMQAGYQWLEIFVNQLPVNKLISFNWNPPNAVSTRILKTLWQRQRSLHSLEILPVYSDNSHGLQDQDEVDLHVELNKIEFEKLSSIRIVPDTSDTAYLGCAALQLGVITDLEVDARLWQEPMNQDDEDDHQDSDDSDEENVVQDGLTESIFDHLTKVKPGRVPAYDHLTTLVLKDVDLTSCKHTWFCYLNLCHLKHLTLEHCKAADIFLIQASPGAATPRLHSFVLLHDLGTRGDRTIHAINELLGFPRNTMRKLVLSLRNSCELPSAAKIRAHGKTLHTLLLDVASDNPGNGAEYHTHLVYTQQALQNIVSHCKSLKELGIAMPGVNLEYMNFGNECQPFATWIDLIAQNLDLATLNIINWPVQYKAQKQLGYYAAKAPQLARLASDVFVVARAVRTVDHWSEDIRS
ncbi:hypothetical protein LTR85_003861 [Meristemomyces frigidus]|nr:hypothetical protein LTR85_003861 [Meristemomyces frigidus]